MNLPRTRSLIHEGIKHVDPLSGLVHVLESAIELIELPDNDFAWSAWESAEEAKNELNGLLSRIRCGDLPERSDVSFLFAVTGPLQETSLSSGWGETFLKVAERFDEVERKLWKNG